MAESLEIIFIFTCIIGLHMTPLTQSESPYTAKLTIADESKLSSLLSENDSENQRQNVWNSFDVFKKLLGLLDETCLSYCPESLGIDSCKCDENCVEFGDCCINAPGYHPSTIASKVNKYTCAGNYSPSIFNYTKVYMKTDCEDGWGNEYISSLCAKGSLNLTERIIDPLLKLPVTNTLTSITYPNYYCAICNYDTTHLETPKSYMTCNVESMRDWKNLFNFSGWEKFDTQNFNYSFWRNFNITAYNDWELTLELDSNEGFKNYVESNLYYDYSVKSWAFSIEQHGQKSTIKCDFVPVRPRKARECVKIITTCAPNWTDNKTETLCKSYFSRVQDAYGTIYRNRFCAECNHVPMENLECFIVRPMLFYIPPTIRILLTIPESFGTEYSNSPSTCSQNETFIQGYSNCNSTMCRISNAIQSTGICIARPNKTFSFNLKSPEELLNSEYNLENQSLGNNNECMNTSSTCDGQEMFLSYRDFSVHDGEIIVGARRIPISKCNRRLKKGIILCLSESQIIMILGWISSACLVLSVVGTISYLIACVFLSRFKNLPGKNLACLCICLLTAYISLLISPNQLPKTTSCYVLASLMYFSFFASFCWMNVIAFDTWYSFRRAIKTLVINKGKQWKLFSLYSLYSWLLPTIALIILITIDQFAPEGIPLHFYPKLGQHGCWFGQNRALLLFFIIPKFVFISMNSFFFLSTAYTLSKNKSLPHGNIGLLEKNLFKIHTRLLVLMGITWISGIIAYATDNVVCWYIFVITNSLQGSFIFVAFVCRREVWRDISTICGCHSKKGKSQTNSSRDMEERKESQRPYITPRIELLHVSSFLDNVHHPPRLNSTLSNY